MGRVAKSYMKMGFLIYEEMRKYLTNAQIVLYMTLQPIPSESPYI
jgi:hypothetical protein